MSLVTSLSMNERTTLASCHCLPSMSPYIMSHMHLRRFSLMRLEQHLAGRTDTHKLAHRTPSSVVPWVIFHIKNGILLINASLCASRVYNKWSTTNSTYAAPPRDHATHVILVIGVDEFIIFTARYSSRSRVETLERVMRCSYPSRNQFNTLYTRRTDPGPPIAISTCKHNRI